MDTYEKKYKEALERAKEQLEGAKVFDYKEGQIAHDIRTTTYAIFPELKESKDEKTRKRIIALVNAHGQGMYKDDMLTWLEKQSKQKPAWSEEDEEHYRACLQYFDTVNPDMVYYKDYQWLKSLKQKIGG